MHFICLTIFITALFCANGIIEGKPTGPSSANIKDYVKYLLSLIGVENEYTRFLSYVKIYPPEDKKMKALYDEYFSLESYLSDLTDIYTKHYTLEDILKLIDFYSSSLGKKTLQLNHELNHQMEDVMLTKISDYIFTSTEKGFDIILPQISN
ncbi:unnamed protein product [Adineta steineri]|uniref:DUF2059 domain-containing protein n=1 Tax=Adineta steineri TaxID=433720 RepID=A0A815X8M3_9BILA|nr:unnamed protein product [Adineta steineri]CAF1554369.1 unnamed protein product [Adineta steineri]